MLAFGYNNHVVLLLPIDRISHAIRLLLQTLAESKCLKRVSASDKGVLMSEAEISFLWSFSSAQLSE